MDVMLWLSALGLVLVGVFVVIRRELVLGSALIVLGVLVGPGGVSVLR